MYVFEEPFVDIVLWHFRTEIDVDEIVTAARAKQYGDSVCAVVEMLSLPFLVQMLLPSMPQVLGTPLGTPNRPEQCLSEHHIAGNMA